MRLRRRTARRSSAELAHGARRVAVVADLLVQHDLEVALAAIHRDRAVAMLPADLDGRGAAGCHLQLAQRRGIDSRLLVLHRGRRRDRPRAVQRLGEVQRVQARVHQCAPTALVDREPPARPVRVVADPRAQAEPADLGRDHVPDHPLGDELAQLARRGVPEVVVVHGELHPCQLGGRDHRVAIGEVERERLLAQHVDAARRRRLDDLAMRGRRRADADHVDVVTREQVAIVRVASRRLEAEEVADEVRAPGRGIGDGYDLHAVRPGHRGCVASLDDPAATNQSEAHSTSRDRVDIRA